MINPRLVVVPPDTAAAGPLLFPTLGPADSLDHVFDFTSWVCQSPDDRVAGIAAVLQPSGATLGTPVQHGSLVTVRIGPGAPGAYAVGCGVVTAQGRQKTAVVDLVILPA